MSASCFRTDRIKPGFFRIHSRLLHLPASRPVSWSGGRSPGQPTSAQAATRYKPVSRSASRPARSARSAGPVSPVSRPAGQPAGHLVMPLTGWAAQSGSTYNNNNYYYYFTTILLLHYYYYTTTTILLLLLVLLVLLFYLTFLDY